MKLGYEKERLVKRVKKTIPWASHLVEDVGVALDLNISTQIPGSVPSGSKCIICKGSRQFCGKTRCPLLSRLDAYLRVEPMLDRDSIAGSSPPGVFVGRIGYPDVYAGPMVPPYLGDTSLYDMPEEWFGRSMEEIVRFRLRLVRGKHRLDVRQAEDESGLLKDIRLAALAENSVDMELHLRGRPRMTLELSDSVQPMGPSAMIEDLRIGNVRVNRHIQKAHYDTDLKASEAIKYLHGEGLQVSKIQKALSVGSFGQRNRRRLVPTRWSITATDSILSQSLMEEVKRYPAINEFRIYESSYLDNRFEILMMPEAWRYETMEAWYPGTIWNPDQDQIHVMGDWEGYSGRTAYASIGGCYYAARLAVNEKLASERRQASVIILREAHPAYIMPVGVWQVRENVRHALKQRPLRFNTLGEALERVKSKLDIRLEDWVDQSSLLKSVLRQRKITDYAS